jgi:hypothetical protein
MTEDGNQVEWDRGKNPLGTDLFSDPVSVVPADFPRKLIDWSRAGALAKRESRRRQ